MKLRALPPIVLIAAPALAQQELHLLGRFNKIWRIDAHDTANVSPVHVTTWAWTPEHAEPTGLEIDPATGDYLLLTSPWNDYGTSDSQLSRVDPSTGTTTIVCKLPHLYMRGLERRWDGTLLSISENRDLIRIDLDACTTTVTPLDAMVGSSWSPCALDERGMVVSEAGDLLEVDPAGGQVTALGIDFPGALPLGGEVDHGDVVYLCSLTAALWRYEPQNAQWVQLLPDWNTISNGYDLAFTEPTDGADFTAICDGDPNSTGVGASLELIGSGTVADDDLELYSHQLPVNQFGYYVMGTSAGNTPVGNGTLCIAAPVFRFSSSVLHSGSDGRVRFPLDLTSLANGQAAMPGDVYLFQMWYRDVVGAGSNFSAAAAVTFH